MFQINSKTLLGMEIPKSAMATHACQTIREDLPFLRHRRRESVSALTLRQKDMTPTTMKDSLGNSWMAKNSTKPLLLRRSKRE